MAGALNDLSDNTYPRDSERDHAATYQSFYAPEALTPSGWRQGVRLEVVMSGPQAGKISNVELGIDAQATDEIFSGPLMPGVPNLHSHIFQRAIAGRTATQLSGSRDHFWTWREAMYRAALNLSPDQVEAIAAQGFLELLSAGYTSVAEFHYLHHDTRGERYQDLGELSKRVISAARRVGIAITHLPVLYRWSGVNEAAPLTEQRRFTLTLDEYASLIDGLRVHYHDDSNVRVGRAPHSLRAVSPQDLKILIEQHQADAQTHPLHLHIAEQRAEVEMWLGAHRARPIEWLLDHAPVDQHWCLVHATHLDERETERLARSRAVMGLCPTTEADLGDGLSPLPRFLQSGGVFGIGSDSNLRADPAEELRLLEWGQRLKHEQRNISFSRGVCDEADAGHRSLGVSLHLAALRGGMSAMGREASLEVGSWADWVILDPESEGLEGARGHRWSDQWIFATRNARPHEVYVAGSRVIKGGEHPQAQEIRQRYQQVVSELYG